MARFKSKAIFPAQEIMHLIARWKGIDAAGKQIVITPEWAARKQEIMDCIGQKATPLFTAFAVGERYPEPMRFAELCRARVPVWVATLALDRVPGVFSYFSICTCAVMRQLQFDQARKVLDTAGS